MKFSELVTANKQVRYFVPAKSGKRTLRFHELFDVICKLWGIKSTCVDWLKLLITPCSLLVNKMKTTTNLYILIIFNQKIYLLFHLFFSFITLTIHLSSDQMCAKQNSFPFWRRLLLLLFLYPSKYTTPHICGCYNKLKKF